MPESKLKKENRRLRGENDYLRGLVASVHMPCVYCKLPLAEMGKCQSGFPGCARADDMLAMRYPPTEEEN